MWYPYLRAGRVPSSRASAQCRDFVRDTLLPGIESAAPGFQTFVSEAFDTVVNSIKEDVLPHLTTLWEFFRDNLWPIIRDSLLPAFI